MIAQKATVLCIYEILKKYTDENHLLSTEKIREKLKTIYDVDMERRAIYRNIEALRSMGIEIEGYRDNREGYYLIDRDFELSEIRLLCDAVATSDMIKEDAVSTRHDCSHVRVKISSVPSVMKNWVLKHIDKCEVIGLKRFRDEIQRTVMGAYKKYWK